MLFKAMLGGALLMMAVSGSAAGAATISLEGEWGLKLDPRDVGVAEQWQNTKFSDQIKLPGSLAQRGFGEDPGINSSWTGTLKWGEWKNPKYAPYRKPGNFKMPFWLQPKKVYVGAVWYQKMVTVPEKWSGKHIELFLERAHWQTTVWVDSKKIDSNNSLSTPHVYDLSAALTPGPHRITIRVDNRMIIPVGINSHSVSDHTQGNWNGLVGKLELRATAPVYIDDMQVFPDVDAKAAKLKITLRNTTGKPQQTQLTISGNCPMGKPLEDMTKSVTINSGTNELTVNYNLGAKTLTWDAQYPWLYTVKAALANGDSRSVKFGLRKFAADGTNFAINGRKTFLRGTLECAIFPLTGYPPTDDAYWRKIIKTCKAYGLNHIRFHSWCPPEAAFRVADELGFYYQVECASWANAPGSSLGDGLPVDKWLYKEGHAIIKAYGNHPSFVMMAYGNEPGGRHLGQYLVKWCTYWKKYDSRHLYTSGSGWPLLPQTDYNSSPNPRIQGWGQGLRSIINGKPPSTAYDWSSWVKKHSNKPTVSHEIGQWCVYPNFDEISKYTGVMQAKNFEIFRDFLREKGMLDQAHDFLMASGKLQALCYKADIEAALRTPGFGGFQLLDLHDFPGQGTALVGVLDPFWDSKPYISGKQYSHFCNMVVPLARLNKMVYTTNEKIVWQLEVANYCGIDLGGSTVSWSLKDVAGKTVAGGKANADITAGGLTSINVAELDLSGITSPGQLRLEVAVKPSEGVAETLKASWDGHEFVNGWNIWVYPAKAETVQSDNILVTNRLDDVALNRLKAGGKVLLTVPPSQVKTRVRIGFSSIFWNTAWTGGQAPHTLGILCNPKHPVFAEFPTEYHSDWQWWYIVTKAATLEMDNLPRQLRPLVQVVPDWFAPKRLGLLFEAKVGGGQLMVCSVDLTNGLDKDPARSWFRKSILDYMRSDSFKPSVELAPQQVRSLYR